MKTSLKTFLADLYEIDPSLQSHEADIIPLVEKLMKNDPAVEPDTEFVKRLRIQLKDRAADLSAPVSSGFQKWLFALGGAVSAAIILPVAFVAVNQMKDGQGAPFRSNNSSELFGYSVTDGGKNAFGPLSGLSGAEASGRGGGGDGVLTAMPDPAMAPSLSQAETANSGTMDIGSDAKMIAPYPMTRYEYKYDGAFPELSSTVAVYKRRADGKSVPFSAIGSSLNLGSIDLASFGGMNMDMVTFSQNKPFGYQLSVNLRDTSVSLDAQWDQWPMSKCQTEACFQNERVKLSDIPSEDQLIAAASAFVKDHNIDVSKYGTPEVDMQWKRDYDRATDKNQAYIPDQIRVIYPVMIDGHTVSDQSGFPTGISVGVHIKTRKVMNVYGIMSREYVKSDYAGVSDSAEIKKYLGSLDNYAWMPEADQKNAKTATVTLGEPVMGYSVFYKYDENISSELLIPSLTFPIENVQGGDPYFYRASIVVPLAAELLKEQMNGGMPIPLDGVRAM